MMSSFSCIFFALTCFISCMHVTLQRASFSVDQ